MTGVRLEIKMNYYRWFSCLFIFLDSAIARMLPTDRRDLGLTRPDPDVTRWLTLSLILVLTFKDYPPSPRPQLRGGGSYEYKEPYRGSGIVTQPIFAGIVPVNINCQRTTFPAKGRGTRDLRTVACYGAAFWEIYWPTLVFSSQPIREPNNKRIYYPGGRFWKKKTLLIILIQDVIAWLQTAGFYVRSHSRMRVSFWNFGSFTDRDPSLEYLINLTF